MRPRDPNEPIQVYVPPSNPFEGVKAKWYANGYSRGKNAGGLSICTLPEELPDNPAVRSAWWQGVSDGRAAWTTEFVNEVGEKLRTRKSTVPSEGVPSDVQ